MNVLVVSGIWPPDVGGPASHAPEVAAFLLERGHGVRAVVTASAAPAREAYPIDWVPRRLPPGARHAAAAVAIARRGASADVVYATGMFGRAAVGAAVARTPLVLKLTADPAYERARRRGLYGGSLEQFQHDRRLSTLPLRAARDAVVRRAAHVVCPSSYLRELALGWGAAPAQATVLPNPAPATEAVAPREQLRERLGITGPTLAFAGRLTRQKSLEVALDALARLEDATLLIAGEGPERDELERLVADRALGPRVRFLGPQPRQRVLELYRAADLALLSSSWENFPHAVVEALAVGTPVVSTRTGGVAEVVRDGVNGLLVPVGDSAALAEAVRRALADERLREQAAGSVDAYRAERVFGRLEAILEDAAR